MRGIILTVSCTLLCFAALYSQSDVVPLRKDKYIIETNYSFLSTVFGGNTGFGVAYSGGDAIINLGIDFGKFSTENLALKGSVFLLSADCDAIIGLSGGIKYYAGGRFIINPSFGVLTGGGETALMGSIHLGFAIRLADNIYLEPGVGARAELADGTGFLELRLPFMLLF